MKFLKDILSEIQHIKETLNEVSIGETQAKLEWLEKRINNLYDEIKIVESSDFIEEKSLEDLCSHIIDGQTYSPEALEAFRHFYNYDENAKEILCDAYKVLKDVDFKINENETEDEVENRREQISNAMYQYATNNSLEWDGESFWEPSTC